MLDSMSIQTYTFRATDPPKGDLGYGEEEHDKTGFNRLGCGRHFCVCWM